MSRFAFAQQGYNQWSAFQHLPGYSDDTLPPYLIVDQNKTIHAFTSQWVGQDNPQYAVIYNKWSLNEGWTSPVDILLPPRGEARVMGAFLDKSGFIHVIFYSGDDKGGDIYYSKAPAVSADRATAWMASELIGKDGIDPNSAALVGDNIGNLVIVYNGNLEGTGLYVIYSSNGGDVWSEPASIYTTNNNDLMPFGIQLYLGASGDIHAVWNVVDQKGHNQFGYYAKLNLKTHEWTIPEKFDKSIGVDEGMGIANPTVIEYKYDVFIMYNNGIPPSGVPPSQWFVKSTDGGKTWTLPQRISQRHVGRNGVSSFFIDSNDILHVIFADRIPITVNGAYDAIGGVYHSVWSGVTWSDPEAIVERSASQSQLDLLMNPQMPDFSPYDIRATISQGNVILATWRTDPGAAKNGVWYSYLQLDTPELPIETLRVANINSVSASIISISPTPSASPSTNQKFALAATESSFDNLSSPEDAITTNPGSPLIISVVVVVIVLSGVVGGHLIRRK